MTEMMVEQNVLVATFHRVFRLITSRYAYLDAVPKKVSPIFGLFTLDDTTLRKLSTYCSNGKPRLSFAGQGLDVLWNAVSVN